MSFRGRSKADSKIGGAVGAIAPPSAADPAFLWRLPRTETFILAAALGLTAGGKLTVLIRQSPEFFFAGLLQAVMPDILFFLLLALLMRMLFVLRASRLTARVSLCLAALALLWSMCDMGWLIRSGVQLQPGILWVFLRDTRDLGPLLLSHLMASMEIFTLMVCVCATGVGLFVWRFAHPAPVVAVRREHVRWATAKLLVMVILLAMGVVFQSSLRSAFAGEVLAFSSHWHALAYSTVGWRQDADSQVETRNVPRAGQRDVVAPAAGDMPHVVLVLLESVSHSMTSLNDPNLRTTPYLAELAGAGVEFARTHVPVSHTTKAYWATLTGSTPVIESNYVEAVPVAQPYEGLASILGSVGYTSAFFEMSKGSFECAPGFFKNLGFDWAWFRENLGDESAHLGYLSGDDCRMIEPALTWLTAQTGPALLTMITSVSHDPYDVPIWFDDPAEEPCDKYVQSLRYTDYFLKMLCHALKERGLEENTILCILGDHGTSFRSNTGFARWSPYEEVIRVPWLIRWPGHLEAGVRCDWPCSQLDVTPTLLSLLGFGIDRAGFEGRNAFVPSDADRRLYFSSWYSKSPIGFVEGRRKVVYWPYLDKVFEYDLAADHGEEDPRRVLPPAAEALKEEILEWQGTSQIVIDSSRYTEDLLYSHWRTFNSGRKASAYYVP
ncbi:MAG: sulfatase-like hydrolase/transferase [Phycisphaerae bacterium]|nr:sulfatase-like hydrolase/transferase [Phycisphaerae bacterium]